MFLFPVYTDRRLRQVPWINGAIIAANVIVFMFTYRQIAVVNEIMRGLQLMGQGIPHEALTDRFPILFYYLMPDDLRWYQFGTYQFLHSDWMHLLGNMLFLYVFGNSVEDRLGKLGYLLFYLGGGVIAGVGHVLVEMNPVLGASGAVAAVTGSYLVLFPLSNVTIMVWFIVPLTSFEISSILLILFRVGQDLVFQFLGIGNTAYLAHLAGYGFGIALAMSFLLLGLLPRERYDLLALIEHQRRRAQFRGLAREGYQPWDRPAAKEAVSQGSSLPTAHAATAEGGEAVNSPSPQRLLEWRAEIARAIADYDLSIAARRYGELLKADPQQIMSQQQQLDLANQLMSEDQYHTAATAYELFLRTYHRYPQKHQVQLILGLIYARYLDQLVRAKELLSDALPKLDGDDQALAGQVLREIE